jgi:hypothetical protein
MKKFFLIMMAFALSLTTVLADDAKSQNPEKKDEIQTMFGAGDIKSTFYGALTAKVTQINSEVGILTGGRLCWTINKTFSIGFGGTGLVSEHSVNYQSLTDTAKTKLQMFNGGLFLEYIHNSKDLIHFSANTLIGFGGVYYTNDKVFPNDNYNYHSRNMDNMPWVANFVIEPAVAVEFNITKHFRVGLEASYRYTTKISENDLYTADKKLEDVKLNGFSGGLVFQFGWF